MTGILRLIVAWLMFAASACAGDGLMQVNGLPADRVRVLTLDAGQPDRHEPLAGSWMGRRAGGVLAVLTGRQLKQLSACAIGGPRRGAESGESPWVKIIVERGDHQRPGVLARREDGRLTLRFEHEDTWFLIDQHALAEAIELPGLFFTGNLHDQADAEAERRVIERRFDRPGDIIVSRETLRKRFFTDGFAIPPPAKLKRESERFQARVPRGYDPRTPAGLIVWVSPMPSGSPPPMLFDLADEMGFFLAGADASGNDRPPADRLQLALDVTANVVETYHIDPRRIYVSGLSGGGKIATILQACCPEIFRGCVPIVGTGWWRDVAATRDTVWPRLFGTPPKDARELLRTRRIAPMTGPDDFNHEPVLASFEQMKEDAMSVRLFDVAGMGHQMPPPKSMREAIEWVDQPAREARASEVARGRVMMAEYLALNQRGRPRTPEARSLLQRMTDEAPWTEDSWRAIEWLKEAESNATRSP